jgi:Lrp/AsnC family transcriptional regulator for asnA, asnC and gidA
MRSDLNLRKDLDTLDKKLAALVSLDGQASPAVLSEKLEVTGPTVRTRLKNLVGKGLMKVAGIVDPFRVKGLSVALVGVNVTDHAELGLKLDEIAALDNVHWAGAVTGRYDIMAEVVLSEEMDDLYRFLDEDLSRVGGIASSESFLVMKGVNKWVLLPRAVRKRFFPKLEVSP